MFGIFKKDRNEAKDAMQSLLDNFQLQSFPAIIMEALNDLRDPDISLGRIATKLESDPSMNVKILRTVNSAAFGLPREVTNLQSAVSMMGHARLETILLTHAVKKALPATRTDLFSMKKFWTTASRRACLARSVASRLHPASQAEAFTASLLQDMAVPILVQQKAEAYAEILTAMRDSQHQLHQLESDRFSFDHTDVGGHMAQQWKLPRYLVDAITCHHHDDREIPLDPGIRVAALISDQTNPSALQPMYDRARDDYDLDHATMKQIVIDSFAEADEFAKKIT